MPTKSKTTKRPKAQPAPKEPRVTKQQQIIDALRRPEGVTLKELIDLTGWQSHTVRAVLSGINHGRSGKRTIEQVPIERVVEGGRSYYRAVKTD
jgi:hypothetical protein